MWAAIGNWIKRNWRKLVGGAVGAACGTATGDPLAAAACTAAGTLIGSGVDSHVATAREKAAAASAQAVSDQLKGK